MSHGQTMEQRLAELRAQCAKNDTLLENVREIKHKLHELGIETDLACCLEKKVETVAYNRRRYYDDLNYEHERSQRQWKGRKKEVALSRGVACRRN